jgi:hypothetical protein
VFIVEGEAKPVGAGLAKMASVPPGTSGKVNVHGVELVPGKSPAASVRQTDVRSSPSSVKTMEVFAGKSLPLAVTVPPTVASTGVSVS